jgi:hypothetical protein
MQEREEAWAGGQMGCMVPGCVETNVHNHSLHLIPVELFHLKYAMNNKSIFFGSNDSHDVIVAILNTLPRSMEHFGTPDSQSLLCVPLQV